MIGYHVTSATGFDTVGLSFNGTFAGYAVSSVTENFYTDSAMLHEVGNGAALFGCPVGHMQGCVRTDNIGLGGIYHDLYIQKDINVSSICGLAQISYVDQTFANAPEPSSFAMLGAGLLGAAGLLRRRAKSVAAKAVQA